MRPQAIIFDLDGTLLDSADDILAALKDALRSEGVEPPPQLDKACIGPPIQEILARSGLGLSAERLGRIASAFRSAYDSDEFLRTVPFPGALETVAELLRRGCQVYVATNKPAAPTTRLLRRHFPALVEHQVSVDSVPGQKLSKAQMIAHLRDRFGFDPGSTWMVGDGVSDMEGATLQGSLPVGVSYGYGTPRELVDAGAVMMVGSFEELLQKVTEYDQSQ